MYGLAPSSSALPSAQLSIYQAKLQQARREAEQAQAKVESLDGQAAAARQESARATDKVRALEGHPLRRGDTLNTQGQTTGRLLDVAA